MPKRIRVPGYAKEAAKKGLEQREKNNAGLTKAQADKLGITSGIERAKQIIKNTYLDEDDLKAIARFYLRFRNFKSGRAETALKLWGGRRFGQLLANIYYSK